MIERISEQVNETLIPQENFDVLSPQQFRDEIVQAACGAEERIWMQAMYFGADNFANSIVKLLINAKRRKPTINAQLQFDEYALRTQHEFPNYLPIPGKRKTRRNFIGAQAVNVALLQKDGVTVTMLHKMSGIEHLFPYKGRNHAKITIIDNVAWIGGVNFTDDDINRHDVMIRITDPRLVKALAQVYTDFGQGRLHEDRCVVIGDTSLLVDAGRPGESIILDRALSLIRNANSSILHTSQYTPNGRLAEELNKAARKGVTTEVIVPESGSINSTPGRILDFANRQRLRIRKGEFKILHIPSHIHSKLLLMDSVATAGDAQPSTSSALIGSHNLTETGVTFGTAEVAIVSQDQTLITNLTKYYNAVREKTHD